MSDKNTSSSQQGNGDFQNLNTVKKANFSGKLGFVLAASGSAVGLGNLWRFPYLTAEYGGGAFILCYLILAVLLGIVLLMLEISIGRHTGKSVLGAFPLLNKKFKWFGYFSVIAPLIIVAYYCVIGGWVFKYAFSFITGDSNLIVGNSSTTNMTEGYFKAFTSDTFGALIFFLVFAISTVAIVCFGVKKGIENMSKILMPALAILSVALMIYVLCQDGALEGVKYVLVPNFNNLNFNTVLGALGQLFYSTSVGMCIMITYGSYMKKDVNIKSSAIQIAGFDSAFAIVASLIIIPSVFVFGGGADALGEKSSSLMFVQLSTVFNKMPGGPIIGALFFVLVLFAAITSSVSLVEAIVAVLTENGKIKRITACLIVFGVIIVFGTLSSLGNGILSSFKIFGLGILDAFDYLANNILVPVIAIITCLFAGWFIGKEILPKEIGIEKSKWQNTYFNVIVKYVAPICILIIMITGLFVKI